MGSTEPADNGPQNYQANELLQKAPRNATGAAFRKFHNFTADNDVHTTKAT